MKEKVEGEKKRKKKASLWRNCFQTCCLLIWTADGLSSGFLSFISRGGVAELLSGYLSEYLCLLQSLTSAYVSSWGENNNVNIILQKIKSAQGSSCFQLTLTTVLLTHKINMWLSTGKPGTTRHPSKNFFLHLQSCWRPDIELSKFYRRSLSRSRYNRPSRSLPSAWNNTFLRNRSIFSRYLRTPSCTRFSCRRSHMLIHCIAQSLSII